MGKCAAAGNPETQARYWQWGQASFGKCAAAGRVKVATGGEGARWEIGSTDFGRSLAEAAGSLMLGLRGVPLPGRAAGDADGASLANWMQHVVAKLNEHSVSSQ